MKRVSTILAIAAAALILRSAALAEPASRDDEQLYAQAVATMRGLAAPPYLTFVTKVTSKGLRSLVLKPADGVGSLRIYAGRGDASASWATSYREQGRVASIATAPLTHLVTHSPVFIPVWSGVYEWFRFGVDGRPFLASPAAQPSASPADANLTSIGSVTAISPEAYRISAADPAVCPGGEQARHLHLEPRNGDTRAHPLTDVTIDAASSRFCSVRFVLPLRGARGFSELHFGTVAGYWMTTSDDADIRTIIGAQRAELHIRYDDMRFPATLDETIFTAAPAA